MDIFLDVKPEETNSLAGMGVVPATFAIVEESPQINRPASQRNNPLGYLAGRAVKKFLPGILGDMYSTNLVKVPVPTKKKTPIKLVREYAPLLIEELRLVAPKRILAVGTAVAKVLCPGFDSMREDHGTLFYNPEIDAIVVPTHHFSSAKKSPDFEKWMIRDLTRFLELKRPEQPPYTEVKEIPLFPKGAQVYLDLETTGVDPFTDRIIQIGLTWNDSPVAYIIDGPTQQNYEELWNNLDIAGATICGHNLQFDLLFLLVASGLYFDFDVEDTMMMAHALGEEGLSLKHLTTMYTDRPGSRAYGTVGDYGYLAEDVLATREVWKILDRALGHPQVRALFHTLVPQLAGMTYSGVYIDRGLLLDAKPYYEKAIQEAEALLPSDVNWKSPKQVAEWLLSKGVELTETTEAGAYSVKESVLVELADSFEPVTHLLKFREATKHLEFLVDYEARTTNEHPYLHPKMKLWGAVTGRTSCEDPNLQNVPRTGPAKLVFVSRHGLYGLIGLLDLSQAELRVAGLLSGDEKFVEMLLLEDPHTAIASMAYGIPIDQVDATRRKRSKGITFGLLYGGSPSGLASRVGVGVGEVELILENIFDAFPKLSRYIETVKKVGIHHQEVFTPFGKRRDLSTVFAVEGGGGTGRKAINTPIQGCASEIALTILAEMNIRFRYQHLKSRVLFGVHDSSILDIYRTELEQVAGIAQEAFLSLNASPLANYALWEMLPFTGELVAGKSWAAVESTNENYDPDNNLYFPCSTHGLRSIK